MASDAGIKAIAIGPGRTGSVSVKFALEHLLGGKCYQWNYPGMTEEEHVNFADKVVKQEMHGNALKNMFKDHTAVCGTVAACIWRGLLELYPNAYVIILYRDPEKWFESFSKTTLWFQSFRKTLPYHMLYRFPVKHKTSETMWTFGYMCYKSLGIDLDHARGMKGELDGCREIIIKQYKAFYEDIQQELKDRNIPYIIWKVGDGWKPLCEFMNLPIPDESFPHKASHVEQQYDDLKVALLRWEFVFKCVKRVTAPILLSIIAFAAWKYRSLLNKF